MNKTEIKQSTISVSAQIGDLTEKKFAILSEALKDYIIRSNGNIQAFNFTTKQNYSISITQNAVSLVILDNIYNKNEIKTILYIILDKLMIDNQVFAMLDFQAQVETEDSFAESTNIYKEKYGDSFDNLIGVGYRYLLKGDNFNDDLKKEPLISNEKFFYYQLTRNFNVVKISLDYIIEDFENIINNVGLYFK